MKTLPQSYCAYEDSTTFLLRFVTIGHVFGQFLIVVEAASMCERGVIVKGFAINVTVVFYRRVSQR
jgi:hypothetical protein